ncbi:MAG: 50S ribosomal protein L3 [Bacilli bacterium]|nr:50S ribosomal protein L3 [Bacilli bacterium]
MKGILGRKVGMTEVFTTDGKLIPVTVIEVQSNVVTQIKTTEKDGYNAIQLGAFDKKEKSSNNPEKGHAKKANTSPKRFLKEIRGVETSSYTLGQVIEADVFQSGDTVDVTGTSKGKGFAGVIKRWNQSRGPETHGSTYHRRVGSMGTMRPMRVLKGKKLPGHLGNEQITIQNLTIVDVDMENKCILVSGNVPGPKNSFVFVREAIKGNKDVQPIELISYEEEIVETETVESAASEEVVENNAVAEETVVEAENDTENKEVSL